MESATLKATKFFACFTIRVKGDVLATQSRSSTSHNRRQARLHGHKGNPKDDEVYLITSASESVAADSIRKNRIYAITIGIRMASLFLVLATRGWLQITIFLIGMLAPWIGVQIANTIRQVDERSIKAVPPQRAALEAASEEAEENEDTVIVGDFVVADEDEEAPPTPSAKSDATEQDLDENKKDDDDTGS